MADKKKTVAKTTAPKRARKTTGPRDEVTTDDGVTTEDVVTTKDNIIVEAKREDVARFVAEATNELIAQRAYERFAARGYEHGHDLEDWLAAESEALH